MLVLEDFSNFQVINGNSVTWNREQEIGPLLIKMEDREEIPLSSETFLE